jgi:predicted nuclease with TOPRIM domain
MADPSLELLQTMTQRVLDQLSELRSDMVEVKDRLGLLELSNASLSRRVDRMGGDIDLIKRRLDLLPAA